MHPGNRKACEPCKSSKRKCTKQLPQCRRCELRGLACYYEAHPRMVVYQPDDDVKNWLKEWVETGSSPFTHPELNKKSVPSCVQDAFMALSTYFNKTGKTSDMVYRFIEDKADKLAMSHENPQASIIDEIGRVLSLLIYTFIRLFDGNIRQRHFAEKHLPILHNWTKQMLSHTASATSDDRLLLHNALTVYTPELTSNPPIPRQASPEQLLWHAWILSESVRRTWCVSMMIQSGYELLKTGTGPCFGGLRVTTRRGVWDAKTAAAWTSICAERSVGFLHRNETEALLKERRIDEVDSFPLVLMELDFGPDRMETWRHSSAS
ncbi:hypothetical protein ACHAPT_011045 [Fusarium lateritium]